MTSPIFSKIDIAYTNGVHGEYDNIYDYDLDEKTLLFRIEYKPIGEMIIMYVNARNINRMKVFQIEEKSI